jgi:Flp pilus assembly pilin Flp
MVALINTALLRAMTAVSGLRARLSEERGQDFIEYALLGGLISAGIVVAALLVFPAAFTLFVDSIAECIDFDSVCP